MNLKQRLKPIMFVGTASDVGKSVITAGFCRIFKQEGYNPAPFKGQNMSLNSYATPDGLELGRAQAVQAEAAGIACHTDMNPVLLKPTTDQTSQVIVNGISTGNSSAISYFKGEGREHLFEEVKKAYNRLASRYSPIVMEGAGSISELNLKHRDITNMRMALEAGAATYLITDIDRGGIFASLYGTMQLLEPQERACIKGIIINKFRGDGRLFEDGKKMIEDLCGVPVVGILPYFRDIVIEDEDSVSLQKKLNKPVDGKVNVAVVLLNRMSNFTDFDYLERDNRVNLFFTDKPEDVLNSAIIILPGSKNTIEDLIALKNNGMANAVIQARKAGKTVIGICGGYQMMGFTIEDPLKTESNITSTAGLGILPVNTILQAEKTTQQRTFTYRNRTEICKGYEIHTGQTRAITTGQPVNHFTDGQPDGYFLNEKCWGTYLHGILDNQIIVNSLLANHTGAIAESVDHNSFKEQQYDKLAALIRQHVDIPQILETLQY